MSQTILPGPTESTRQSVLNDLSQQSWSVIDGAVSGDILRVLRERMVALQPQDFLNGGVGRASDHRQAIDYRSDRIHWLEPDHAQEQTWLTWCEQLKAALNQTFFFGLDRYEAHFAHYAPGQRYQRHIDAFKGQANRRVSTVLYLNTDWNDSDGGELVIYPPEQEERAISPQPGRLVTFLSDVIPHEVMPAKRDRYSIAGWFRVRESNVI